jgi:hypothetical protein
MLKHKNRLITAITLLLFSSQTYANNKEYELKAGFLYNFARFGQWQSYNETDAYFTLCSPDKNFITIADAVIAGRVVHSHTVKNKHTPLNTHDFNGCDMLFITANTYPTWKKNHSFRKKNTMLVGENNGFIQQGGHIRFFLSGGKVRFEISPTHLKNAGLTMSSKVLRLARLVEESQ